MADEATLAPDPTIAIQKTAEVVDGFSFTRKLTDWFGAQSWISGESAHTLAVVTVLAALITCCLLLFVLFRPFVRWVAKRILGERGITSGIDNSKHGNWPIGNDCQRSRR